MKKGSLKVGKISLVGVCILLTAFLVNTYIINAATLTGERLKDIQSRVIIGTEFPSNFTSVSDTSKFTSIAKSEFSMVTAENAMEWDLIEPSQNEFAFSDADRLVEWAEENDFTVHGNTLVWHNQTPGWVQELSASEMEAAMYNHIDKVMGRYKGQIPVWDVTNEVLDEDGSYRDSSWYQVMGKSYVEKAYTRARQVDPNAKLVYNDYDLEYTGEKSDAAYNMLKDFKSRGIPVDGVGFQMHLDVEYGFNFDDFAENMQRFADLGLEIYITEMDVRITNNASSSDLELQDMMYEGVIEKCMEQPAVKVIQFRGFTDKYSWIPEAFSGKGSALLFDSNYNPKSTYYAAQSALSKYNDVTSTILTTATVKPTSTTTTTVEPTNTPKTNTPVSTDTTDSGNVGIKYSINSNWGSGATIGVTISNKGSSSIVGWEVQWKFTNNEKITNSWNGSVSQSGSTVTASGENHNAVIPASGSVSFGFNMTCDGAVKKPTSFTLNGIPCVVE